MAEANQAESRALRRQRRAEAVTSYKEGVSKIREVDRNDDQSFVQELVTEELKRSEELYPLVRKKLDGTSADSRHMRELIQLCKEGSKRINASAKPVEVKSIILNLHKQLRETSGSRQFTFNDVARHTVHEVVAPFWLRSPTFEFIYGALGALEMPVEPRKKREKKEKLVETQAIVAKEKDLEVEVEQDSTPKEVEHINKQVKRLVRSRTREGSSAQLPFFKTFVDPKSFTQTVENIFHASFLIKEGCFGVKRDAKTDGPLLTVPNCESDEQADRDPSRKNSQSILSFSIKDYQNWIEQFNITDRAFAPRDP